MILKTAANYNDEGGYIEAWKKSDGTTEVKLIPKSGDDDGKQGLKSISISPAIQTTPALDSLFPIYWDDLTEEVRQRLHLSVDSNSIESGVEFDVTVIPTDNWYAYRVIAVDQVEFGSKGEPMTFKATSTTDGLSVQVGVADTTEPSPGVCLINVDNFEIVKTD